MTQYPDNAGARFVLERDGRYRMRPSTEGMLIPVRCRCCGDVYDLTGVTVTARYADCSVWTTPCCNRPGVDDRPEGWGPRRLYEELS